MKVSLNWAQWYSNVQLSPNGTDDLITKIGKQLGAVEEVYQTGKQYDKAVVARVATCEKHPNADKLSVCLIDDNGVTSDVERNENGLVQVVCGAPNVREGLMVVWLPPGATVPSTYSSDPFVLGARELRGIKSNGMLASAEELAIGGDHGGILELEADAVAGTEFKTLYGLDDEIIDIENKMFTHRPDCFGVLGVAREIAGIYGQQFKSPDWYLNPVEINAGTGLHLEVNNEIPDLVPRFIAVTMENVKIRQSPIWLEAGLTRVGIKPINNIVDITNYLAYITGQPLHAYDYDKVVALSSGEAKLVIRKPRSAEKIALLNGKTVEPHAEAIMIATDKELIGVGGVMGGVSTEVDNDTKNIILECANFNMYSIRKTSMIHGLFTDAVTRNNKGQSPLQNMSVMAKAVEMVTTQAEGSTGAVVDFQNKEMITRANGEASLVVYPEFINKRLGLNLSRNEIVSLLQNVEFHISDNSDSEAIFLDPPFWRTDIEIPEDIVEEVGRLHGFDNMPLELPVRPSSPAHSDQEFQLKQKIRETLASFGANEVLNYSFVHGDFMRKAGQNPDLAFKLNNAISPDLQYYRMSLTPSLLSNVHHNIKSGYDSFSLFEINKTHIKLHKDDDAGLPKEIGMVTFITADKTREDAAYYQARAYLDKFTDSLDIKLEYQPIESPLDYQVTAPFDSERSALVSVEGSNIFLGIIGEYKASVKKAFKLPRFCAGFELDLEGLLSIKPTSRYAALSRYPSTSQDICLEVDQSMSYAGLTTKVESCLLENLPLDQSVIYHPIDIYQAQSSDKKRITYRVTLTSYERTLTDNVLDKLLSPIAEKVGAVRI